MMLSQDEGSGGVRIRFQNVFEARKNMLNDCVGDIKENELRITSKTVVYAK